MKTAVAILFLVFSCQLIQAQYYLRGEIQDQNKNPLKNVRILIGSSGYIYYSGNAGAFGIPLPAIDDSVTISAEGYQTFSGRLSSKVYQYIILRLTYTPAPKQPRNRLVSFTKNLRQEDWHGWSVGGETYSSLIENDFLTTAKFPETGFALNINKASYSNVRRFLNMGTIVPPDAVRTEEMLNYFNFDYKAPASDSNFSFESHVTECPWNADNMLFFLHVCAKKAALENLPPSNLVFLIDISGSMDLPNRLPLLKSSFGMLVNNLREKDTVSIVVYGSSVGIWLPPTCGTEKKKILQSIEELNPGGPTPGEAGIRTAYRLAKSQFIKGGNNRVILATDGDFNVGLQTEDELDKLVSLHRDWGIYLTCLGVGMGNYKDSKLEILANKGNGNFAYLDDEKEAEKVLMKEFTQTMYAVADDAYLDVNFNADIIKEYRLIGFDNKLKALTDSANKLMGGELGSGHSLMAMFEIKPTSSNLDVLRAAKNEFAKVSLYYKRPGDSIVRQSFYDCPFEPTNLSELSPSYRFASSVVMFGSLLKQSKFMKQIGWNDVMEVASESYDSKDPAQAEFITLIDKAKKVYAKEKKRKKSKNDDDQ